MNKNLHKQLVEEILRARERIYHVNKPTPFEQVDVAGVEAAVFLKREDLSAINAYKWRGAYNAIAMLTDAEKKKPIIAASAGNHAQGVALAARMQGLKAQIYMPLSAPRMKQMAVQKHGGDAVEIMLEGDAYNDAADAAVKQAKKTGGAFVHPFDNLYTIAGQATIADEIVLSGQGPFDFAFVQIGGGGMAAGVATWLKIHYPGIKVIGVEAEGQAGMAESIKAGKLVTLKQVDTFCDGTAVKTPGKITFDICKDMLDDIITVSNEEVCAAIETSWETGRFVPEPSGALGLAGLLKYTQTHKKETKGKKLVAIISGTNMDFSRLRLISAGAAVGAHRQKYIRFEIGEQGGSLLGLVENYFAGVNVSGFLYGKTSETRAWPVIAFESSPEKLEDLVKRLKKDKVPYEDITSQPDTRYRVINYDPRLFKNPLLMHVHFPERKGALRELLRTISSVSNICYFNYFYSGEEIGRALMGFEFESKSQHKDFMKLVENTSASCRPVDDSTFSRILFHDDF
ncbi:MAG: pyridoxal-phosphate dependent enzyme [Rhodospirillales bacterium]|nr:pyridoxal-phosphate dependent enzyme [Rhodospirillales bacterium]